MLIFEMIFLAFSVFLFIAYLQLRKRNAACQDQTSEPHDEGKEPSPAFVQDLPSEKTIRLLLISYFIIQFSLMIHSHFYFKEMASLFFFFAAVPSFLMVILYIMSVFDDPVDDMIDFENVSD